MRILMLNNEFPPLGGGTGTVNRAVLQRLTQETDLTIDLITSALGHSAENSQFAERVQIYKVPVNNQNIHHSSQRELLTYAARGLRKALQLHHQQSYDVVFAWSAVPAGGVAYMLRRLTGLPYILRVCGPDIPGFEQRYGAIYPILTPTIKAIWSGAGRLIAKCDDEANMMRTIMPQLQIDLVPNGVDLAQFTPAPIADGGPLKLICVARLIERKGQEQIFQAMRQLHDQGLAVELELVGEGDARADYAAEVARLKLQDSVHFAGYVPREAIAAHYQQAHVFVLPSFNEGMSVATLEGMAAGLTIVATPVGGAQDLIVEGRSGFIVPWNQPKILAERLAILAKDRALVRSMGAAARMRAENFSWETTTAQIRTILDEVAYVRDLRAVA